MKEKTKGNAAKDQEEPSRRIQDRIITKKKIVIIKNDDPVS